MSMSRILYRRAKNWKAECPKCHHVELSEAKGVNCGNCGAGAIMTVELTTNLRQLQCINNCGWSLNKTTCSKCGTTIQGDWFKGNTRECFVASAAFGDEDHPTVEQLRNIRDARLTKTMIGRHFIRVYYTHGHRLGNLLDRFPAVKPVVRAFLSGLAKTFRVS